MSWFNLNVNESLKSLKGQISNVSNVVHDVFTEGILEEPTTSTESQANITSDDDILQGLEEASKKIDELSSLCETKDNEIAKLRQRIELFGASSTEAPAQKSKPDHTTDGSVQQRSLEDSWFWESEKAASSDSSKDNEIAIGAPVKPNVQSVNELQHSHENPRIVDSLRRSLDEKDAEIQRLLDENLSLNEKIKHLHREAIGQDKRLDELDQQHTEALQNLVLIKNELQENVRTLNAELDSVRKQNEELNGKLQSLSTEYEDLTEANRVAQRNGNEAETENIKEIDRLKRELNEVTTTLNTKITEISELNAMLEEKDAHSRDGSDKFELIDLEKEKMTNSMEINRLQTELNAINERLSILKDIKDQYDSNVIKLGSVVSEKNHLEKEVMKFRAENEQLLNEIHVTRQAVEKLEVLQKTLDEVNSEKEQNECAFITLQEDDLLLHKEFDLLRADKEQLELSNSETNEQIAVFEQRFVELQAEYDKLQMEHEGCDERYKELQALHDSLKSQASEVESNLMEENMMTQKKVIDLQTALNSKPDNEESISLNELKSVLSKALSYETSSANNSLKLYLDAFLRSVKDNYQHLSDIELNRDNLMKQFETVSSEKATLHHEYKTLKADLHHYQKEVAELMKNNGILLNQLESVKAGKLETILEHNEDNVLRLESQLEDTKKQNVTLQEDFNNLSHKLDESEEEKYELIDSISKLQQQLDQMRTDDSKLEIQRGAEEKFKAQNEKIAELTNKLEALSIDRDEKEALANELERVEQLKRSDAEALQQLQEDFANIQEENNELQHTLETERKQNQEDFEELHKTIEDLRQRLSSTDGEQSRLSEIEHKVDVLTKEKMELINAIQTKHNENVQYHAKIQELNQMLVTLQQSLATQSQQLANCATCAQFNEKLTNSHTEIATLTDQVRFLKEKSDILTQNLMLEQNNQKIIQQEKIQLNEDKQTLMKDLTRLREHLIEMENAHTAEMIELQNVLDVTRQEVAAMQQEARKSNTAYTSANIRANQQTETIQAQYAVLQKQKEELSARLSEAEDRDLKNQAALTNLQCVLEQFQKDKDRDVDAMTNRIRNELNDEVSKRQALLNEIQALKSQLDESKAGLLAAARLSDQLEISQVTNSTLKEELRKTQDKLHSIEEKLQETESNQADRVDKSLLKNLLIGYVMAPNNDKHQILKLISSVLDFNQQESEKVGLNRSNSSWLNSILHVPSSPNANEAMGNLNKDSLAQAFVKFLENESRPRTDNQAPSLLSMNTTSPTTGEEAARPPTAVQPILLPDAMLQTFNAPRNSSSILKDILNDS